LGNYAAAKAQADEAIQLAEEKGAPSLKAHGMITQGWIFALAGEASCAVNSIVPSMAAFRSTGSTVSTPLILSGLAKAYTELGQFEDARRCIGEAITVGETTGERWNEADIYRTAGEIALLSPDRDAAKAEIHFEHALQIARAQQARSWELRAAISMARLWRDQGKRQESRDLVAPIYGWFTEGFDTLDLKEAKSLLDELE
jgi:predicted ATPase